VHGADARRRRDRALCLIGFTGALRRSELVGLDVANVTWTNDGLVLLIQRSETDADSKGAQIALTPGRGIEACPAATLREWLTQAGINDGPI